MDSTARAKNRRVEFVIIDSGADIKSMNDYYDELSHSMDEGSVLVTGGEVFDEVGGSSEGAASALPEEEINPPDETAGASDETVPPADGVEQPSDNVPTE